MKKTLAILLGVVIIQINLATAQSKPDSIIINVGEKSKVIFAIADKKDLQTLKQYNFQAVVDDIVAKLEKRDSAGNNNKPSEEYLKVNEQVKNTSPAEEEDWEKSWEERRKKETWSNDERDGISRDYSRNESSSDNSTTTTYSDRRYSGRRTHHSFNFDLGTNNYLTPNKEFPNQNNELYSVRPWGSWYVALNSVERTRLARKFFLEWGVGVSWYNFKFENDRARITKDVNAIAWSEDQRDLNFKKSKLTETFVNVSAVPVIDFSGRGKKGMMWDGDRGSFRIGFGPYAGYRIASYSKVVYDDGKKRTERDYNSYYLNNVRYGLRLQVGFRDTDLFFNYDMNELFATGKGPKLNAFSFGITL